MNTLIGLVVLLAVVGILLWAIQQFPMDATIARLIRVLVVVIAALYVLSVLFPGAVPRFR